MLSITAGRDLSLQCVAFADILLPHIADGVLVYVADTQPPPQPARQQAQPAMQNRTAAADLAQLTGPPGHNRWNPAESEQALPDLLIDDLLGAIISAAPGQANPMTQTVPPFTQQQGMSAYNATQQAMPAPQNYLTAQHNIRPTYYSSQHDPAASQAACPASQQAAQHISHYHQEQAAVLQHFQQMAQHPQHLSSQLPQQHYPTAQQLPYGFLQQHSHQLLHGPPQGSTPPEQQHPYAWHPAQGPGHLPQPSVHPNVHSGQQFRPSSQDTQTAHQSSPNLLAPQQQFEPPQQYFALPQQGLPELLAPQEHYEPTQQHFAPSQQHFQLLQHGPSQMLGSQLFTALAPQKPAAQNIGLEDLLPSLDLSGEMPSSGVDYLDELLGAVGNASFASLTKCCQCLAA